MRTLPRDSLVAWLVFGAGVVGCSEGSSNDGDAVLVDAGFIGDAPAPRDTAMPDTANETAETGDDTMVIDAGDADIDAASQ